MEDETIQINLDDVERRFLAAGLSEWGGPARPSEELALAMGFSDVAELHRAARDLRDQVRSGSSFTREQWQKIVVATEFVFSSDVFGSGLDWSITTGFSDAESIAILRAIQRKMPRWRGSFQFDSTGDAAKLRDVERH